MSPDPRLRRRADAPESMRGMRLDRAAAALFAEFSRAQLQRWIHSGELRLNGATAKPRESLPAWPADALLSLDAAPVTGDRWLPEALPLCVVHEDESLIVVDKPAGLVVHPGAGHDGGTLVNALMARYPELTSLPRAGLVHRLDKGTSGLLAIARNEASLRHLSGQFHDRGASREYLAICAGVLTGGGTVDAPLGRHPSHRQKMAVNPDGRHAVTHYRPLRRFTACSYLSAHLETGRTHQLRVHLFHIGHPLLGDPLYGRSRQGAAPMARQALHAALLGLRHPDSDAPMQWRSPLPADFQRLLDAEALNYVASAS